MILETSNKVMIVHRRLYENDQARIFIGTVDGYDNALIKVRGYSWVRNQYGGNYVKKKEERTKIISLSSGTLIVYQLDNSVNVDSVEIETGAKGESVVKDNQGFEMDLSESYPQVIKTSGDPLI